MSTTKVRATTSPPGSLTHAIDRTDKAILRSLQRDASLSNVALAAKVNLSAPACLRRVERLKQMGLITGIVALLNPRALDAGAILVQRAELRLRACVSGYAALDNALDADVETAESGDGIESFGPPRAFRVGLVLRR